jgi:DNA-binding NarL/FixJ family response regulator
VGNIDKKVATILLVDDDAFARQGLRLYLESLHYQVLEAGHVQTAWDLVLADPPQTAVIDIRLPLTNKQQPIPPTEPTGIALTQQFKKNYPTMSIVLLSAHEEYEREVIQLAQQYMRSIAFLHKGGDMGRLETALAEVQAGRTFFQQDNGRYHHPHPRYHPTNLFHLR